MCRMVSSHLVRSTESLSSGYCSDSFLPVTTDTMDTEDYELWDRRTQVGHQGHGGLRAVGQKDTGGSPWKPRTMSFGTGGHRWVTRDTEDYELWDRRTQVGHHGNRGQ